MKVDWNLIRSFEAVTRLGTLAAAASALGSSQPTLSRHLRQLEAEVGVDLFDHRGHSLSLTHAGTKLLQHAKAMADHAALLQLDAAGEDLGLEGTVRISASDGMAYFFLTDILHALRDRMPKVEIEIVVTDEISSLSAREADLAIRTVEPKENALVRKKVGDFSFGVFAASTYLDRKGRPSTPEDLFAHDLVGFDRSDEIIRGFKALGQIIDPSIFVIRTDSQPLYWKLLQNGAGIGFGPVSVGRRDPALEQVLPDLYIPEKAVWLVTHEAVRHTPRVRATFDLIAGTLSTALRM